MASPLYQQVLELAVQLPPQEQQKLISELQAKPQGRPQSAQEWMTRLEKIVSHKPLAYDISLNRADWYDDDGR